MGRDSTIEWTDHTFNPWWGCTKVSPGCTHCYAERLSTRYGHDVWGPRAKRRTFGEKHWAEPLKWENEAAKRGRPARVFCASMADVFEDRAPKSEQKRLWKLIEATPNLRWLLLTKRPERILGLIPETWRRSARENVWYGTSVESTDFTARIAALREVPAVIRFLSVEPLLGPIPDLPLTGIQWVIVGGESGPGSRPMAKEWVTDIRDQCQAAGVAFFFKQWGGLNKKATGRVLDRRVWAELPEEVAT